MNDERAGTDDQPDERAAAGVEHLQAAAHEMIEAARAFLDVIEDFVGDERKMASIADAVTSVARGAARAVQPDRDEQAPGEEPPGGSVQHIRVS